MIKTFSLLFPKNHEKVMIFFGLKLNFFIAFFPEKHCHNLPRKTVLFHNYALQNRTR